MVKISTKIPKKKSVIGVIFNEDKTQVLLVKRRDMPIWVLPGGGIENDEQPEEAVLREVLEETGFNVKIKRKVGEYIPINRLTSYTHLFECAIISGKPAISNETKDIRYWPINDFPLHTPPPYPDWIEDTHMQHPFLLIKKTTSLTYPFLIKHLLSNPLIVLRFLLTRLGIHINT